MIDTSVLIAGLVQQHPHHAVARRHLTVATRIPAIVLAESYSQLRRTYREEADVAVAMLSPWATRRELVLATTSDVVEQVFRRATELDLGGNIHDALVAQVCAEHDLPLATLDRRQHQVALALGADSTYLLAGTA